MQDGTKHTEIDTFGGKNIEKSIQGTLNRDLTIILMPESETTALKTISPLFIILL